MGNDLKYGHLRGGKVSHPWEMTAAEVINDQSGKFCLRNATTGFLEIAGASDSQIWGWAEAAADSASDSGAIYNLINDLSAVFRIPLAYDASTYTVNYSDAIKGETCDLVVDSGIQYANPTLSTYDNVMIVGGKAATGTTLGSNDGYVDVMMNPNKMYTLGTS